MRFCQHVRHCRVGERSSPSQVQRLGIGALSSKAGLDSVNVMAGVKHGMRRATMIPVKYEAVQSVQIKTASD